jgi:predicted transcriptional regulator
MKNTTAKVITKKLHGWLDDRAKHVPLPPLPDEILAKAVFQVPDSWVPVYAVSFDCDKGEEPAPDAWLKPDGQIVRNQNLLAEHAKTFGMPEGFLALYFGDAEQDAVDGACQCIGCRLNRLLAGLRATENAIFEGLFDSADANPLGVDTMTEALQEELGIARQAALYSIHQMKESLATIEKGIGLAGNLAESARIASGRLSVAIAHAEELMASIDEQEPWKPETITETMEAVADGRLTPHEAARIVCDMVAKGEEND